MTQQEQELSSLFSTLSIALLNLRGARSHVGSLDGLVRHNVDGWAHAIDDVEFRLGAVKEQVGTALDHLIKGSNSCSKV